MMLLIKYKMITHAGVTEHEKTWDEERVCALIRGYVASGLCQIDLIRSKRPYKKKEK